jgi:carboxylesterase type B
LCLQLGYKGPTEDKYLLEFLENAGEKEIIMKSLKLPSIDEKMKEGVMFPFGPTIEPFDNGNMFLCDEFIRMAESSWGNEIDIMIGATSNEYALFENFDSFKGLPDFNGFVPIELGLKIDSDSRSEYGKMLMKNYYGLLRPSKTNVVGTTQLINDICLWHPLYRVVKSRENSKKGGKTFIYRFDIDSENNLIKKYLKAGEKYREPVHEDDVPYYFKTNLGPTPAIDSPGFKGIKLMTSVLSEFAKVGNPNVPEIGDVEWKPESFDEPLLGLNIDEVKCEMKILPEQERIQVLSEIFKKEGKKLY